MIKKIVLLAVFVLAAFNICSAVEMTLDQVNTKIATTKQELDTLIQTEPKTPEIDAQIVFLRNKLLDLKTVQQKLISPILIRPIVIGSTGGAQTGASADSSSSSSSKASSSSSSKTSSSSSKSSSSSQDTGANSTGEDSGSSLSDALSQPTVMAALISAIAVISTTLIGIFARRR